MSIWNSNQKSKLTVICDIGSSSVAAGLVFFSDGQIPVVLHTVRIPISIQESPELRNLEPVMIRFLEVALKQLTKDMVTRPEVKALKSKAIDSVYAVYSSPWYVSKSTTINLNKKETFILDKKFVEKMMDDEEKKFEEEAISGKYDSVAYKDIKMIERELVRVKLNGYETSNPFLKGVKDAELSFYMSLIQHSILVKMQSFAETYLHTKKIYSHTFPLVSFGAVKNLFPYETDFLLLDITGEMTDVSMVHGGVIIGSTSFSKGRNFLIRAVGEKFDVTPDLALSYLDMSVNFGLEESMRVDMEKILEETSEKWDQDFTNSLEKLNNGKQQPLKLFVSVDADVSSVFVKKLKKTKTGVQDWSIIELNPTLFTEKLIYGKFVFPDPFISLEALFFAKHVDK